MTKVPAADETTTLKEAIQNALAQPTLPAAFQVTAAAEGAVFEVD